MCLSLHDNLPDCYYFHSSGASFGNPNGWETPFLNVKAPLVTKAMCCSEEACVAFEGGTQYRCLWKDCVPIHRGDSGLGQGFHCLN